MTILPTILSKKVVVRAEMSYSSKQFLPRLPCSRSYENKSQSTRTHNPGERPEEKMGRWAGWGLGGGGCPKN